jgi:hypothetical protein
VGGHGSENEGDHVAKCERRKTENGSVAKILELAAHHRIFGLFVIEGENGRARKIEQHFERETHTIKQPANFQERSGKVHEAARTEGKQEKQRSGGEVQQYGGTAFFKEAGLGLESQAKVKKDGGRQQMHGDVAPIHEFVKGVEVAGIMETTGAKGSETEQEKLARFGGTGAAVVDKEADTEIEKPNHVLVIQYVVAAGARNIDIVFLENDSLTAEVVADGRYIERDLPKSAWHIERRFDGKCLAIFNGNELISQMNAGDLTGSAGGKVGCDNAVAFRRFLIDPTDTIVMQDIVTQVPNA